VHRFDDHARMARSVAIAPAGDALASGARDGTLVVRRGPGFAERIELPARPAPVEELAFSRDGAVLAVLTADGAVAHLDAATGAERAALPGPAAGIYAAALGPEGATSAFASAGGTLRVFEPATGARLAALRLSDLGRTLRIELTPDGRVLALAVSNASTRLIAARDDVADPTIARLPLPPGGYVDGLAFSPDGARLAVGSSDDVVRVLDAVTGFELLSLATDAGGIRCLAFAPDGRRLVVGGADGRAEVWW
jgi:WD40 repeat protein